MIGSSILRGIISQKLCKSIYVFEKNLSYSELINLLNNSNIKFDGVDGKFYFKDNMIERDLDILKINKGTAEKIN